MTGSRLRRLQELAAGAICRTAISTGLKAPRWAAYAGLVPEVLRLQQVPYEHPDVAALEAAAQQFYVQIYGGPDGTPFTTADFSPPHGAFFVGYLDEEAVAMGGWRFRPPGVPQVAQRPAEIRRMFVAERVRGRGFARLMLTALEASAAAAGADWMLLETGQPQVAAIGLYRSSGYVDVERFGYYAASETALNLGRPLG
jgi:ribosomal protein S18 acetylase RimI-like enzyme